MGQIVLLDPNVFFYGLWLGIQSVLDPVTRSKVVMLRGEAAREAYADVQWRGAPDPGKGSLQLTCRALLEGLQLRVAVR